MKVLRRQSNNLVPRVLATAFAVAFLSSQAWAGAPTYTASYYTVESCLREGTSGIMANGRKLDDTKKTCAMWGYPFGTQVQVTNINNGRSVLVTVTDRGPAKRLVKKGRIIDLSKKAFTILAPLSQGIIPVEIKILPKGETWKTKR